MEFFEALSARHSSRAFVPGELVPRDVLDKVLEGAARSASSKNVQPWGVCVLQGNALEKFRKEYSRAYDSGQNSNRPFQTDPVPLPEVWDQRAKELGKDVFAHKGVDRDDKEKRQEHARRNFIFF